MATRTFSNGADTLSVTSEGQSTFGDDLFFLGGNDTFINSLTGDLSGANLIDMGAGNDQLRLGNLQSGTALLGDGDDIMVLDLGTPDFAGRRALIDGGNGADVILSTASDVDILGGAGNDVIGSRGVASVIDAEGGIDSYVLAFDPGSFLTGTTGTINLATQTATYSSGQSEQILNFENAFGNDATNDTIIGDGQANILAGLGGDDTLGGAAGDDIVNAGPGVNVAFGDGINATDTGFDTLVIDAARSSFTVTTVDGGFRIQGTTFDGAAFLTDFAGFERFQVHNQFLTLAQLQNAGFAFADATARNAPLLVLPQAEPGGQTLNGNGRRNTLDGGAGDDTLNGRGGNDRLNGNGGDDILSGGSGKDKLTGGAGVDRLNGGGGADQFLFAEGGGANADRITGFRSGSDRIGIDASLFDDLDPGAITRGQFKVVGNGGRVDATDRVIYDADTGRLSVDADGRGGGGPVLIATMTGAPDLAFGDILII